MGRKTRDMKELQRASDHLFYEIEMLRCSARLLSTGALGESMLANMVLDSLTMHARAVMDFLYESNRLRDSDVLAIDFPFGKLEWNKIRPTEPSQFDEARRRVGKEIAHLTYDRQEVAPALKGWDFVSLATSVLGVVKVFADKVDKAALGERWRESTAFAPEASGLLEGPTITNATTDLHLRGAQHL